MKNFIGGLFKSKKTTNRAYWALQSAGIDEENIMILERKRRKIRESGPIRDVAIAALIGAVIGAGIASILGYMIGQGTIVVPAFRPDFTSLPSFVIEAYILFLAQGAVTGAILGVAVQLALTRRKPAFTRFGIKRGGMVLAVNTTEGQKKDAKRVMEEAGAVDLADLSEKWNYDVWSNFKQIQPPLTA